MRLPYNAFEASRSNAASPEATQQYEEILEVLRSDALAKHIEAGNVTVAMIRPKLETSTTNISGTDPFIADSIEGSIANLGILAKFSLVFDEEAFDGFYDGAPKEVQLGLPPVRNEEFPSRWAEFEELMTSGPTTVLLLYTPDGDAIQKWRAQVGHWNVVDRRDPETIRGKFGLDNYNNLIHGSDAPESATREVDIIATCLEKKIT